ncbi:hypothetical protein C8P68_102711 [Mucilaginibacter yixingensis]|uniref:Prealbumin-like fold domain-containing protein n=1 Tax=Mucilaginibacter yixingensis TaxID=1295612 RepID=A0A2T5JDN4_9SPHI|nr:hypothetical protein [Mucilaginibacter yixingensis]PTQ99881.1 hypothetical protein C8P68_102711 [Mucilaginibacter yixingensis]
MKKIFILSCALLLLGVSSCKKNDKTTTTTNIAVTVKSGVTQTASSGATVNLYVSATAATAGSAPDYNATADQTGKATFSNVNAGTYYVVAVNGAAKNYYSGLIPIGYTNGAVVYQDTNGDGKIDANDKVTAPSVTVASGATSAFTAVIY